LSLNNNILGDLEKQSWIGEDDVEMI